MRPMIKTEKLPRWDLSNVFPGMDSPEFKRARADVERKLKTLESFLTKNDIRAGGKKHAAKQTRALIDRYLNDSNALIRQLATLGAYVGSFVTTDSFDKNARKAESEMDPLEVRLNQIFTRFTGWIGDRREHLPALTKAPGPAHDHAFYLEQTAKQSRYLMSEAEESLASELSMSGVGAWGKLQGTIVSQISVPFEREGKTEQISMPALLNIQQHDPDAEVRREAYELELKTWKQYEEPLAAAMNGVKGAQSVVGRRRGRKAPIDSALDAAHIDRKTLDAMLGAMTDSFPVFRKYLKAKSKKLGNPGALPWWDLMAPVGTSNREYSWAESRDFILGNFGAFSPRLHAMTKRAYDKRWIDAEQRKGKRAGAFCMGVPAVDESRILCNYDGSLDQVSTVAHELGHAFHNECQIGQPYLRTVTPMTLAETASIFCENIIIEAALKDAGGAQEELAILETDLIGKTQVIVDITSRYLFETEVFKRREKSELSADELCALMLDCQKQTYGDGLDARYMHPYMWTWKPHYYFGGLSFYNFPYAFGLLFGLGLYAIYRERGAAFVPEYEQLLASTGQADAATLAKRFKIDIRKRDFWKGSLDVIGERIDRYVGL
jgi:pepF/M3 family oligoendopeptidase